MNINDNNPKSEEEKTSYVSNVSEWRETYLKGIPVELPSGKIVHLRPMSIVSFLTRGVIKIPNSLTGLVDELMSTGAVQDEKKYLDKFDMEQQAEYYRFVDQLTMSLIVSPKVVYDYIPKGDDELSIQWFEETDKQWILQFFNMPATALESFRYPENTYVGIMDAMQGVQEITQRGTGDSTDGETDAREPSPA